MIFTGSIIRIDRMKLNGELANGCQTRASHSGCYFTSSIDLVEPCIAGQGCQPNGVEP